MTVYTRGRRGPALRPSLGSGPRPTRESFSPLLRLNRRRNLHRMVGEGRYLQLNTPMDRSEPTAEEAERRQIDAARRDPAAFAPLYAAYFDPIYRYCYLRLHHRELAADAASQTFLKALAGDRGISLGFLQELALRHRPQCDHRYATGVPAASGAGACRAGQGHPRNVAGRLRPATGRPATPLASAARSAY